MDAQYRNFDSTLHFHLLAFSKHTQIASSIPSASAAKSLFTLFASAAKRALPEQNLLNEAAELQAVFAGQAHYSTDVARRAANRCFVGAFVKEICLSSTALLAFRTDPPSKYKPVRTISCGPRRSVGGEKRRRSSLGVVRSADSSLLSEMAVENELQATGRIREYFEQRSCHCFDEERTVRVFVSVLSQNGEVVEMEMRVKELLVVVLSLCEMDARNGWRLLSCIQSAVEKHDCAAFHHIQFTKQTEARFAAEYLFALACHSGKCACGCSVEWSEEERDEIQKVCLEEMRGVAWIVGVTLLLDGVDGEGRGDRPDSEC